MGGLLISVSGARGIAGDSMTEGVARDYAAACAAWMRERCGVASPTVCIGRDARPSGTALRQAATAGLRAAGCRVVDLGIVATPTAAVMVTERDAHGGIVVTASHNPREYNGIKCLDAAGGAPAAREAERIAELFRAGRTRGEDREAASGPPVERVGDPHRVHVERVLAGLDADAVRARGFRVVLDSCGGAGGVAGRTLLERLGCSVVHLYGEPTGECPHGLEPTERNLVELAERTAAEGADAGFAQDPDADRLAIVDETGAYVGEEYTLALGAHEVLAQRGPGVIAANLSTSRLVDDVAALHPGSRVVRSAVGEANVAAAMRAHDAVIGGEGNGGLIDPAVCWVRDSLSAMGRLLALLARRGATASQAAAELPRYAMIKRKIDLAELGGRDAVAELVARVAEAFAGERADTTDGVRIDFDDGWAHLRPSNTEPIARLIAEAANADQARVVAERLERIVGQ